LEDDTFDSSPDDSIKTLVVPGTTIEHEKALLRYFVTWHVLSRLGISEERIRQCLLYGMGENDGWEEALEWVSYAALLRSRLIWLQMWLHCSEDECYGRGDYAKHEGKYMGMRDCISH
jgi:hypothetical protein